MKKYANLICLLVVLLVAMATYAAIVWVGSMQTVNNTTYISGSNSVSTATYNPGTFLITDGGLTATTAMTIYLSWSMDGTNFFTNATFVPTVTNAGTYTWAPGPLAAPIWQRFSITTTNSVNVGIIQQ